MSKFKYRMKISELKNLEYYANSNIENTIQLEKIYGVLDINIIPF